MPRLPSVAPTEHPFIFPARIICAPLIPMVPAGFANKRIKKCAAEPENASAIGTASSVTAPPHSLHKLMKKMILAEEFSQFALGIFLFSQLPFSWWWFPALLLLPDLSMIGYAVNPRMGAALYNVAHHKATGILAGCAGWWMASPVWMLAGIILFSHAAMDRVFGYGLKFPDDFRHTHLGWIGKNAA